MLSGLRLAPDIHDLEIETNRGSFTRSFRLEKRDAPLKCTGQHRVWPMFFPSLFPDFRGSAISPTNACCASDQIVEVRFALSYLSEARVGFSTDAFSGISLKESDHCWTRALTPQLQAKYALFGAQLKRTLFLPYLTNNHSFGVHSGVRWRLRCHREAGRLRPKPFRLGLESKGLSRTNVPADLSRTSSGNSKFRRVFLRAFFSRHKQAILFAVRRQ